MFPSFRPEEFRIPSASASDPYPNPSSPHGGCVAVAVHSDAVGVRDTKDLNSPTLVFTPEEWSDFVRGVKAGEFDLP